MKIFPQINVYFLLNPHVMNRNHVRPFIINTSAPQASNTKSGPFTDIKSILTNRSDGTRAALISKTVIVGPPSKGQFIPQWDILILIDT